MTRLSDWELKGGVKLQRQAAEEFRAYCRHCGWTGNWIKTTFDDLAATISIATLDLSSHYAKFHPERMNELPA